MKIFHALLRTHKIACLLALLLAWPPADVFGAAAPTPMRILYPSFAGSWATTWIAKEAGYFVDERLDRADSGGWQLTDGCGHDWRQRVDHPSRGPLPR